jgi:hypothetical protein
VRNKDVCVAYCLANACFMSVHVIYYCGFAGIIYAPIIYFITDKTFSDVCVCFTTSAYFIINDGYVRNLAPSSVESRYSYE